MPKKNALFKRLIPEALRINHIGSTAIEGISTKPLDACPIIDRMTRQGKIIAPLSVNVLPHEMDTARAIADYGYDVEFVPQAKGDRAKSADFVADGVLWEVKSPSSGKLKVVEKHLRSALHQSRDIVFDSRRMKGLSNDRILSEVAKWGASLHHIRRLLYVDKTGSVVKIK